jgi:hypothetical protein
MRQRINVVASLVVLAAGLAFAESPANVGSGHSNLHQMIREAHTPQQYQQLASYFKAQQQTMEQKAQVEKAEWQRRSQNTASAAQKYPRPVDSSRNWYEYLAYEADQMGRQAAHYESLSAGGSSSAAE